MGWRDGTPVDGGAAQPAWMQGAPVAPARPKAPIETPAFEREAALLANPAASNAPEFEKEAAQLASTNMADVIAANPVTRFALGAASPLLGLYQLGANALGKGDGINQRLRDLEGMKDRGKKMMDSTAMNIAGGAAEFAGELGSTLALPASRVTAATMPGRIGAGMALGGAQALVNPVTGEGDYLPQKAAQVGTGIALGGVMPPLVDAAKKGASIVRDVVEPHLGKAGLDRSTGRAMRLVAGDKSDAVIDAMVNNRSAVPGTVLTAGQAAVPAGSAEFSALQRLAAERNPSLYSEVGGIGGQQEAARRAAIERISRGVVEQDAARRARSVVTTPMRETALENANLAGRVLPELQERAGAREASRIQALQDQGRFQTAAAQQENLAVGGAVNRAPNQPNAGGVGPARTLSAAEAERAARIQSEAAPQMNVGATGGVSTSPSAYPVPGQPRIPPRYTDNAQRVPEAAAAASDTAGIVSQRAAERNFAKMQADSLAQSGNFPLKSDGIIKQLDRVLGAPGMRASDVVTKSLADIKDKIAAMTQGNGVIDANDLYMIRKELGDSIQKNALATNATDKRLTSGLQIDIQKAIDNAIEGAGNAGWKDYLKKYAEMSGPINEMKLGQKLKDALTSSVGANERETVFANAVRDAGDTVSRSNNRPLIDAMSPKNRAVVDAIVGDMKTGAQMDKMAREGVTEARDRLGLAVPTMPATGMFSPKLSVTRGIFNRFEGKANDAILKNMAEVMQNPQEAARLMREATPAQRKVLEAMLQASQRAAVQGATDR
jgi:hypothetical protein